MEDKIEREKTDFEQMRAELNDKYFQYACDIFAAAKDTLLNEIKEMLGEEYTVINENIQKTKKAIEEKRAEFNDDEQTIIAKGRLTVAKEKLVMATSDNERELAKKEMNEALTDIAKRNLAHFNQLSVLKKEMDDNCVKAINLVKARENEFKDKEEKVIKEARQKTTELAVGYKSEISALVKIFEIDDCDENDLPFLTPFDMNMRLVDFDKNSFMDAFYSRDKNAGKCFGCSGDCSSCRDGEVSAEKKFFKSTSSDTFNS